MMSPGDEKVVADKLYTLLSTPPVRETDAQPAPPAADVSGQWDVLIEYTAGRSSHKLHLRQQGNRISGTHQGDFVSRDLTGTIDGDRVQMRSTYAEENGDSLSYGFDGTVAGDDISGTLDMGEYLKASWTAKRHQYRSR
jgi:L-seryl-tRNA(Ser) seleniumtransferase